MRSQIAPPQLRAPSLGDVTNAARAAPGAMVSLGDILASVGAEMSGIPSMQRAGRQYGTMQERAYGGDDPGAFRSAAAGVGETVLGGTAAAGLPSLAGGAMRAGAVKAARGGTTLTDTGAGVFYSRSPTQSFKIVGESTGDSYAVRIADTAIDGAPLEAKWVVGRRDPSSAADHPVPKEALLENAERISGSRDLRVPAKKMPRSAKGSFDPLTKKISISTSLPEEHVEGVLAHEIGHAIDPPWSVDIPKRAGQEIWSEGAFGKSFNNKTTSPEGIYPKKDVMGEMRAEAIRHYLENPEGFKKRYLKIAQQLRKEVNRSPYRDYIQLNNFAVPVGTSLGLTAAGAALTAPEAQAQATGEEQNTAMDAIMPQALAGGAALALPLAARRPLARRRTRGGAQTYAIRRHSVLRLAVLAGPSWRPRRNGLRAPGTMTGAQVIPPRGGSKGRARSALRHRHRHAPASGLHRRPSALHQALCLGRRSPGRWAPATGPPVTGPPSLAPRHRPPRHWGPRHWGPRHWGPRHWVPVSFATVPGAASAGVLGASQRPAATAASTRQN